MNMKNILQGLALVIGFLVGGFVVRELLSTAFATLEFIIGGVIGVLMMSAVLFGLLRTRKGVEDVVTSAKAAVDSVKKYHPEQERQQALDALATMNERVRTSFGVSSVVLDATERLIDPLGDLIDRLYKEYPGDETTWTMGAVATDHLPRILDGYFAVDSTLRTGIEQDTLTAIAALAQEVSTIDALLNQSNIQGARVHADGIKARFGRQDFT